MVFTQVYMSRSSSVAGVDGAHAMFCKVWAGCLFFGVSPVLGFLLRCMCPGAHINIFWPPFFTFQVFCCMFQYVLFDVNCFCHYAI